MKPILFILITLFTQSIMAQKIDNSSLEERKEKPNIIFMGEYYKGLEPYMRQQWPKRMERDNRL